MKLKIAGLSCLIVLVGAWVYAHAQIAASTTLPAGTNGRYQVIAADIDSEGMGGNLKHNTAIRIDTQTGKTWSLDEIDSTDGGMNFYWVPLQEGR